MNPDRLTPPPPRHAIAALTRFDGRQLVMTPWFLVGMGIPTLSAVIFFLTARGNSTATWEDDGWMVGIGFFISAIFSMVAVNRAALRDHREHTREQHQALPVGATSRVFGLVAAASWPAMITMGFFAAVAAFAATQVAVDSITVFRVLQTGALVMLFGALGVASAAWIENAFVGPAIGLALYIVHPGEVSASWHAIWPFAELDEPALAGWHLVYLLGLTILLMIAAAARWEPRQAHVIGLIAATAVVAVSLVVLITGSCPSTGLCLL